jgi:hypothetical protein
MCILQNIIDKNGNKKDKGLKCYKFHKIKDQDPKLVQFM